MNKFINIITETTEDEFLLEFTQDEIQKNPNLIYKYNNLTNNVNKNLNIRPTVFVYVLLTPYQKKMYDLLHYTEPVEVFECPVCYIELNKKNQAITNCKHKFCEECLIKTINSKKNYPTCPCCRTLIISYVMCCPSLTLIRTIMISREFYYKKCNRLLYKL